MPAPTIQALRKRVVSDMGGGKVLGSIIRDSFFMYAANFAFVAGTENFNTAIAIQSDSHFICVMSMRDNSAEASSTIGGLVTLQGGGVIQLTDTGGGQRQLSNIPVPVSALFGLGREPYVWPFTHLFRANAAIGINLTGAGAATMANQTLRIVFAGFKIPTGALPQLGL